MVPPGVLSLFSSRIILLIFFCVLIFFTGICIFQGPGTRISSSFLPFFLWYVSCLPPVLSSFSLDYLVFTSPSDAQSSYHAMMTFPFVSFSVSSSHKHKPLSLSTISLSTYIRPPFPLSSLLSLSRSFPLVLLISLSHSLPIYIFYYYALPLPLPLPLPLLTSERSNINIINGL